MGWRVATAAGFVMTVLPGEAAADELAGPVVDAAMGDGLDLQFDLAPDAAVTCAADQTLFGIDVSKWQGQIDWQQAANSGVTYAIIRATHGTAIIDEWFDYNWEQAHENGVIAGVYQYFEPAEDPIVQADIMLEMMGQLQPGDLPPVIDVESATNSTPAQTAAAVRQWIDHVEAATGVKPIIYTGRYFWQDNVMSAEFADYPLWIAHYTTDCPNIPDPWTSWAFHQYSSSGSVPGIAGAVDTNLFDGDLAALMAMTVQDVSVGGQGALDSATCAAIEGWAFGDAGPAQVTVAFDGTADDPEAIVVDAVASLPHPTACDAAGCDHGFSVDMPWSLRDGEPHSVAVTLPDATALGTNDAVACTADLTSARLRPLTAAGFDAWRFDARLDVLTVDDDTLAVDAVAFPDAPLLVEGESLAGLWWIDSGVRRLVDPGLADVWQLDLGTTLQWPDASVDEIPLGPPLPAARRAVELAGTIYAVDVALDGDGDPTGGDDSGSAEGGSGGEDADGDGTDGSGGDPGGADDGGGGGCGCRASADDPRHAPRDGGPLGSGWGLGLWGLLGLGVARRRGRG
jgi:GH25 family lysozyme M1 (1,4-beta-N-acetylmuramidase)